MAETICNRFDVVLVEGGIGAAQILARMHARCERPITSLLRALPFKHCWFYIEPKLCVANQIYRSKLLAPKLQNVTFQIKDMVPFA